MRRSVALMLVALMLAAVPAIAQDAQDHLDPVFLSSIDQARVHGTVTPPGTPLLEKQAELDAYDNLVFGYRDLTEDELTTVYFKDGRFDRDLPIAREYYPRSDVRVVRDAVWGVPRIYGNTDLATAFGVGYTSAEDRLPIMEALRALGRAEAFELLEHNEAWLADAEIVRLYGYTEDEFQAQIDRMPEKYGQEGQDIVDMLTQYAAGVNYFILQAQQGQVPLPVGLSDLIPPNDIAPWRPTDVVAVVAIVRALFGAGGGNELGNATRWLSLVDTYGPEQALTLFEDFRNRLNDDGPIHTLDESFSYHIPAVDTPTEGNALGYTGGDPGIAEVFEELATLFPTSAGAAAADLAALEEESRIKWENIVLDTPGGVIDLSRAGDASMSNWMVVDGSRTESGRPILLGGPQAGYFDPQILQDFELHSPTIHASGAGFPGMGFVVIGRNERAAWTATAGGSDMIDTYIEILCDPDGDAPTEEEVHYLFDTDGDGELECVPMDVRLHREATTLPGGELVPAIYVERTIHGPVTGRGMLGDVPVAVSRKRSTYMKELDPAISILRMNRGEDTAEGFIEAFATGHNLSTNWAFASDDEIAYFHGGLFPYRPDTIHPDFPVWGTGQWEWEAADEGAFDPDKYYTGDMHPHEANPERGYAVSWNNRQAPNWGEDDSGWGFSSIYRADMLEDQVLAEGAAGRKIDEVRLTQLMEHAGLTDLRGALLVPLLAEVMAAGEAPSDRAQQMLDLLVAWNAPVEDYAWGAIRRDADQDGVYDDSPAIAIMDAWWDPLIHAMFDPALGQSVTSVSRQGFHDAPGPIGSAFQGGFYGQVRTDLEMALGNELQSPTSQTFCGTDQVGVSGTLQDCAAALWASLEEVGAALAADQGAEDPTDWTVDANAERIRFTTGFGGDSQVQPLSMHWVNRPTTQVLAAFGDPIESGQAPVAVPDEPSSPLPATGGGLALLGLLAVAGATGLPRRRVRRATAS